MTVTAISASCPNCGAPPPTVPGLGAEVYCTECGTRYSRAAGPARQRVVITGLAIPFWDLVVILVKAAIAAIPALLILTLLAALVGLAVWAQVAWLAGSL